MQIYFELQICLTTGMKCCTINMSNYMKSDRFPKGVQKRKRGLPMKREKEDLSVMSVAMASKNKTAISGMFTMNFVLAVAYAIEVAKEARSFGSYLIILMLCVVPSVLAAIIFMRKKDSVSVRYVFAVGFALLYAYIMLTTTTNLAFCYVIVAFVILLFNCYFGNRCSNGNTTIANGNPFSLINNF